MKTRNLVLVCLALAVISQPAFAQGTAFTYQGRLNSGGNVANGSYDLAFATFNVSSGAGQVGGGITNSPVAVSNGLFTVQLDFGAGVFTGPDRWLEISVRTNGGGAFTTLTPRQKLTPTPYAITATAAASATTAASVSAGAVATAGLQAGAVDSSKILDGTILSGDLSPGLLNSTFWKLLGNGGTTAGVNFLGTTDNQPLELKVNGQRAFRLEPTAGSPNVIGGSSGNNTLFTEGATVGGGTGNIIDTSYYSVLGGGMNNRIGGVFVLAGTIGGGSGNRIGQGIAGYDDYATIGGGSGNAVAGRGGFIGGGETNNIWGLLCATIGGGRNNRNGADVSTIAGGDNNYIFGNDQNTPQSPYAAIGGGYSNAISIGGAGSVIAGGRQNYVVGYDATIAGGVSNRIDMLFGSGGVVGGGQNNLVTANYGTVSGGANNWATNQYATVAGGFSNTAAGPGSVVGGGGWDGFTAGSGNFNAGPASTIGGGIGNRILNHPAALSLSCTIAGGAQNWITSGSPLDGTPAWSVISGGQSNLIDGLVSHSTIGGGSGNRLVVQGDSDTIGGGFGNLIGNYGAFVSYATICGGYSNHIAPDFVYGSDGTVIAGGRNNSLSGHYSSISGGFGNSLKARYATIGGGLGNAVLTDDSDHGYGTVGGGQGNLVQKRYGTIPGGTQAKAASYGQMAYASGQFATTGDAQTSVYVCRGTTADNNLTEIFLDGVGQRMSVPTNSTWCFDIIVTGRAANGTSAAYHILGEVKNNAGTVTLGSAVTKTILAEDAAPWDATVSADSPNGALVVKVTGQNSLSVRWAASVRTVEVTY